MATRAPEIDPAPGRDSLLTAGVDVGTRSVRIAIFDHSYAHAHGQAPALGRGRGRVVATSVAPVQGRRDTRDARQAIRDAWASALRDGGIAATDVANIASTGVRARAVVHVGHFYRGLGIAEGARHLYPRAVAVLDIGVAEVRCLRLGHVPEVERRTRLAVCRSGEMLEQLARRSGLGLDELALVPGALWIYDQLVERVTAMLRRLHVEGGAVLTGGMVLDARFAAALRRRLAAELPSVELLISPEGPFAGAYGAALLAARRYRRIADVIGEREPAGEPVPGEAPLPAPRRRAERRGLN